MMNQSKQNHNTNWPYIPDHPYRILIIGGSGSGKTNMPRSDIDKLYVLYLNQSIKYLTEEKK